METRKRRRVLKNSISFAKQNLSLTIVLCCSFFIFMLLLSRDFRVGSVGFRPSRIIPHVALMSNSVSNSVQDLTSQKTSDSGSSSDKGGSESNGLQPELRIDERVLFSDHVLVILSTNGERPHGLLQLGERIDCVYHEGLDGSEEREEEEEETVAHPMLSADEYEEKTWIVRCPLPPANYSASVGLKGRDDLAGVQWELSGEKNETVRSWDYVVYGAVMDGDDSVAVFVKGLNLRADRESDPIMFSCRFEVAESKEKKLDSAVHTTKAISAAQEVIRCNLPPALKAHLRNKEDIHVSIEVIQWRSHGRGIQHQLVPSIAKLQQIDVKDAYKYNLCACTMVWNQAAFIREWITYHSSLGVERWFLYDNNSDDGLKEVVKELDAENYNVTRHAWPWVKSQEAGFSQCVLRTRDQCKWVAFFDVDEFYYFPPPKKNSILEFRPDSLQDIVNNVSASVGEIRTDCLSFGPSGLKEPPAKGVTLGYTCRLRSPERHKSIVRPVAVADTLLNQVHHFRLKKKFKKMSLLPRTALINHFKYQVWDVFKAKFYRRVSTYVADWQENQNENSRDRAPGLGTEAIEPQDWHKRFCEVWDTRLRDFVLANLSDPMTGLLPWERSVKR